MSETIKKTENTIIRQIVRQYVRQKFHETDCLFCRVLKNMKGEK